VTNPFVKRGKPSGWVVPVSLIMLIIGFMASTAFIRSATDAPKDPNAVAADNPSVASQSSARITNLETEIKKLQEEKTADEQALANRDKSSETLNSALQDSKRIAAMTEAEGPGVMITLEDSHKSDNMGPESGTIHDIDVLKVVNELWSAGAEAVSIDDRRFGPSTTVRCVGPTVLVDQQKIASPITIKAIGSSKDLLGGLNLPGGVLDELRQVDPAMVRIETQKVIRMHAWAGSTSWNFGSVPKDSNK
jgi:uncharacterized protein YlxW (UPF0749 family)